MTVRDLLAGKGRQVYTTTGDHTVLDAVLQMNEHKVGALVVVKRDRIVGIFTERDVLRRVVTQKRPAEQMRVEEVMTAPVRCAPASMELDEASRLMRDHRIRHLPVCDDQGKLVGLISIGDLNAQHVQAQQATIEELHHYVYHST